MTLYEFRLLTPLFQLQHVVNEGTYLAQRWENEQHRVNLCHCPGEGRGFFVEVGVEDGQSRTVVLRSFVNAGPLEGYGHYVRLPIGW